MHARAFLVFVMLSIIIHCDTQGYVPHPVPVARNVVNLFTISIIPSNNPSMAPSPSPTYIETLIPTASPSISDVPTESPTEFPTPRPTTRIPTIKPSKIPTCRPTILPTPFPVIFASRYPTPLPTFPPTMNYMPTMSPTNAISFRMVMSQTLSGVNSTTFFDVDANNRTFIRAVVDSINATMVNFSCVSILAIYNAGEDSCTVKYQVLFYAGSIDNSASYCTSYLASISTAVIDGYFARLLHQYADINSALATAECGAVTMNECSNNSPPSYHYVKGPKEFNLSVVGVIVGIIIVIFGCCCLGLSGYYGYPYLKKKIYPYEDMDLDELAQKLSEKKKDNEKV